jgi:NAD(P)H-hydrate epimerase
MKAVDAATMKGIDRRAVKEFGMRIIQLMENAGRGVAEIVLSELGRQPDWARAPRVSIVAGKGNNGGDGFVAARHLKNAGVDVSVYLLGDTESLKGDALVNAVIWTRMGGVVKTVTTKRGIKMHESALRHSGVIVDAMLGTGISEPVTGIYAEVIELLNSIEKRVVAVDVPSGIDATTGAVLGVAVQADVTATIAAVKIGLLTYPAREKAGRIEVVDIGLPAELLTDESICWNVTEAADVERALKPRSADSHKGSFGHLLLVAGSPGKTGAAYMAAIGAMRTGVGLATLALPESLNPAMEAKSTEVMTAPLPESSNGCLSLDSYGAVAAQMNAKSALVVGPGLGTTKGVRALVELLIKTSEVPVVVDADGLNALGNECGALKEAEAAMVITPHPGEAARLLGVQTKEIQADRIGSVEKLAEMTGAVVVLKGACSIIAAPESAESGRAIYFNTTGNAGLASAGTGDVLAGMIGALLAGGQSALDSAVSAVYLHGLAADMIKERVGIGGMLAMDLVAELPAALNTFLSDDRKDG